MKINCCMFIIFILLFSCARCDLEVSVIIVGAGAAGVAAAAKFLENNHTNILILEAESRIGGRINSVKYGNTYIDLGASFCSGEKGNIVYELAKDFVEHDFGDTEYFHSSKGKVSDDIESLIDNIFETCDKNRSKIKNVDEHQTVAEFCTKILNDHLAKLQNDKHYKIVQSIPFSVEKLVTLYEGVFNWTKVPFTNDYEEIDGDQYMVWKGKGYKTLLDILLKKVPDSTKHLPFEDKLLLNKEISKIDWNDENHVKVQCTDGSHYSANHLIFTPSLGVLKHDYKNLFVPNLPQNKENAIENLGYGAFMQVYFHFPNQWWKTEDFDGFGLLWDDNDIKHYSDEFSKGSSLADRHWLTEFVYFEHVKHSPNMLLAWIAGELVPDIENLPKETLMDGAYFVLKKFLKNNYDVSKPDDVIYTKWHSNPHFRGTVSHQTIESLKNHQSLETELSEPLLKNDKPLMLFAGEATHPHHFGSVHGAVETGFREADRLLKFMSIKH